jgi:hypothetical protein
MQLRQYFNRRLTARETVVIVVVLAALGGAGYLVYQLVTAKVLQAKVDAAFPKVCGQIREQRGKLVSAIEAYKAKFGVYPPDHVLSRQPLVVDPVTNTLFYELVGVIYNRTNKMFESGGMEAAEEKYVKGFFQVDGFKNCGETPDKITRFLNMQPLPARQLHDDPDTFVVGFQLVYDAVAPHIFWEFQTSPWRYVASAPTNNPGKFDLWIELKAGKRQIVIGNWKAVE